MMMRHTTQMMVARAINRGGSNLTMIDTTHGCSQRTTVTAMVEQLHLVTRCVAGSARCDSILIVDQLLELRPIAAIEAYFESKGLPLTVHTSPPEPPSKEQFRRLRRVGVAHPQHGLQHSLGRPGHRVASLRTRPLGGRGSPKGSKAIPHRAGTR